jgi:hypothetical protein
VNALGTLRLSIVFGVRGSVTNESDTLPPCSPSMCGWATARAHTRPPTHTGAPSAACGGAPLRHRRPTPTVAGGAGRRLHADVAGRRQRGGRGVPGRGARHPHVPQQHAGTHPKPYPSLPHGVSPLY